MKKTFYTLSALILSASMVFTACGSGSNSSEAEAEATAATDSTSVILAPAGSIVYIDMTKLMSEYQMAIDLGAALSKKEAEMTKTLTAKENSIKAEIKRKQDKLTTSFNDLQEKMNKGLYTQTVAEAKYKEVQQQELELNQYAVKKDEEFQKEAYELNMAYSEEALVAQNTINDAINTFIAKYNQEKKFAMILRSQGDIPNDGATALGNPVLTADPSLDITADVLAGLNAEYKASK